MVNKQALYTHRINTGITEEQNQFIKKIATKRKIGEGEFIREMFNYYIANKK
jgi:hypothetical protein